MDINKLTAAEITRQMKIETIFGWGSIVLTIVATIILVIITLQGEKLSTLRPLIMIPFGIWYGNRCLSKAKKLKEALKYGNSTTESS